MYRRVPVTVFGEDRIEQVTLSSLDVSKKYQATFDDIQEIEKKAATAMEVVVMIDKGDSLKKLKTKKSLDVSAGIL
jgi:hypothetical protein